METLISTLKKKYCHFCPETGLLFKVLVEQSDFLKLLEYSENLEESNKLLAKTLDDSLDKNIVLLKELRLVLENKGNK